MEKKKNKNELKESEKEAFLSVYVHTLYRYVGRQLLANKKFKKFFNKSVYNKKYEEILKKANLKLLPEEYFVSIYITIIGSLVLIFFRGSYFPFH